MNRSTVLALVAMLLLVAGSALADTNYIVNGGFETGDYTGWTSAGCGPAFVTTAGFDGWSPHSGTYFSAEGGVGCDHTLSQTFSDVAGQALNISFWYGSDGGITNDLNVYWDGTLIYTETNRSSTQPAYLNYNFGVIATGNDTLTLGIRNDPSYQALDDVSVSTAGAVPEPSSLVLLGSGLIGIAGMLKRKIVG